MARKLSKPVRIGVSDYKYVQSFANKRGVTLRQALHLICRAHAEIALSPIQKAQRRILQAVNELNPEGDEPLKLFLARVNKVLDLVQKGHNVRLASERLADWIRDVERVDAVLDAEKEG